MRPTLIAIAGPSRSGKGTCASILAEGAESMGLAVRERQLSGPGKQYVASAFRPEITEEEAIAWFDELKKPSEYGPIMVAVGRYYGEEWATDSSGMPGAEVPLQIYLQRMLQGARDRWGKDFWTDKLIPGPVYTTLTDGSFSHYTWWESFRTNDRPGRPVSADLCLISDLRQESEAERVKAIGGYIVEMQRPELEHSYVTGSDHVTEKRLSEIRPDLVDYIIKGSAEHNEQTFAQLKQDCRRCFDSFVRPKLETT